MKLLSFALPVLLAAPLPTLGAAANRQPNIILILADDLGYHDLSCQGASKLKTPGIDRLAKEGIRLTDAHAAAGVCCPSRYGLMTGRYPWRRDSATWASPGAPLLIEPGRTTVPALLKQAGYATGIVGKWHLGYGSKQHPVTWNDELTPGPLEVGFDYFFGHDNNRDIFVENHRVRGLTADDPLPTKRGMRSTGGKSARTTKIEDNARILHESAVAFLEKNKDRPFFLYYAPNNVHVPLTPAAAFRGSSQCGVYGDFVQELDWTVGELLAALDRLQLSDNTLVIFSSDNGGRYELETVKLGHRCNAPLNGQKTDVWDGGNRVPFLARWPGHIPAGTTSARLLCLTDMLATLAALTGQTLPPTAGEDSFDALPLLLNQPPTAGDRRNLVVQSLFAPLANRKHHGPADLWAVREGNWVLVLGQGSGYTTNRTANDKEKYFRFGELEFVNSDFTPQGQLLPNAPPMQLYDVAADIGQTKNVYRDHPEIVAHLKSLFDELARKGRSRE